MRVKALRKIYYAGKDRNPGDEYDMDDREAPQAHVLAAVGCIVVVTTAIAAAPKPPVVEANTKFPDEQIVARDNVTEERGQQGDATDQTRRRYYRKREQP